MVRGGEARLGASAAPSLLTPGLLASWEATLCPAATVILLKPTPPSSAATDPPASPTSRVRARPTIPSTGHPGSATTSPVDT